MENIEAKPNELIVNSNNENNTEPVVTPKVSPIKKVPTQRISSTPKPTIAKTRAASSSTTTTKATPVAKPNPTPQTRVVKEKVIPAVADNVMVEPKVEEVSNTPAFGPKEIKLPKRAIQKLKKTKMEIKKKELKEKKAKAEKKSKKKDKAKLKKKKAKLKSKKSDKKKARAKKKAKAKNKK